MSIISTCSGIRHSLTHIAICYHLWNDQKPLMMSEWELIWCEKSNECYGFNSDSYNLIMSTCLPMCHNVFVCLVRTRAHRANKLLNNNNTTVCLSLSEFCVKREVAIILTILALNWDESAHTVQVVNAVNCVNKYTIAKNNLHVIK